MHTPVKPLETLNVQSTQKNSTSLQDVQQLALFLGVFESFIDGILILTEQGKVITANPSGRRICEQLLQGISQPNLVPEEILKFCDSFTTTPIAESKEEIFIESEISAGKLGTFRLRAQWLRLEEKKQIYLVVIIEDRYHALQAQVDIEAKRYNLTSREAEVWLLRRANYTYQKIADSLYITLDTVKKHLKNIYAKQKAILNVEE
jgi:DNA-binding CsgD family transcriptional regulator